LNNSEENIYARDKAIRYIGISKKTEYEVKNKLKGLKIASSVIEQEIEYLKELGYIDDVEYVKSYIKQCDKMHNYSLYEISNKLLQKGIKASIIEQEIDILRETNYEEKVRDKLINGKLKSYDEIKQKNYLYRRGFKV